MDHIYEKLNFGPNWFSYSQLYADMVSKFPSGSHFVEIGSFLGKSAAFMAVEIINSNKSIRFDCIDPWPDNLHTWSEYESVKKYLEKINLYESFLNNIEPIKDYINPVRAKSIDAVDNYKDESLDFVFIDGDHDYEFVYVDIKNWLKKIKIGGTLAGHEYNHAPVRHALKDNNILQNVSVREGCWVYNKK